MKARVGAQVSRKPPPQLPGGYVPGEQVYYTGASETFEDHGDRLEHGKQGEVVGPATSEGPEGKSVALLFPGNKSAFGCYLIEVRHTAAFWHRAPSPPAASRRPLAALLLPLAIRT